MTGLTGAGVIERPQTIGGLRRRRRGHPQLLEQRMAELEVLACSRVMLADGWEKDVLPGATLVVAAPADMASKGSALEKSVVGLVTARTRSRSLWEMSRRAASAASDGRPHTRRARVGVTSRTRSVRFMSSAHDDPAWRNGNEVMRPSGTAASSILRINLSYLKTAFGLSRLWDPSSSILPRSRAAITRSIVLVWSRSPSMAACTTALPSLLPSPIIWS